MSLDSALYSYLTGVTGVTDLVSTRIYNTVAPQAVTAPYVTFQQLVASHSEHFGGAAGLIEAVVQIDCWAHTPDSSRAIGEAIRQALHGFSGSMGTEALDVRRVGIGPGGPRNTALPSQLSDDIYVHRTSYDYSIWHAETVPVL